jgi:hypothetical protein
MCARQNSVRSGRPNYIGRIQALGTLLALELNRFAFIQRLVARVLNRRKMYKYIFARRPLDEPIALRAVEPLHNPVFFHIHSFSEMPVIGLQSCPRDTESRLYRATTWLSGSST